jgi:hypothetical protein
MNIKKVGIVVGVVFVLGVVVLGVVQSANKSAEDIENSDADTSALIETPPTYYEGATRSNKADDYVVEPTDASDVWSPQEYSQLAQAIANNFYDIKPLLDADGKPIFDIVNFKKITDKWFVARVKYHGKDDAGTWVILKKYTSNGNRTKAVLGPATSFDVYDFYEYDIPLEVYYSYNKV